MKLPKYELLKMWSDDGLDIKYAFQECVSCAECIFFDNRRNSKCELSGLNVNGEDYCSKGRAK